MTKTVAAYHIYSFETVPIYISIITPSLRDRVQTCRATQTVFVEAEADMAVTLLRLT